MIDTGKGNEMKIFSIFIIGLGAISIIGIITGFFIDDYDQQTLALMAIALFFVSVLLSLMIINMKQNWKTFH